MTKWTEHVKAYAKKKGITYSAALKDPNVSKGYKKQTAKDRADESKGMKGQVKGTKSKTAKNFEGARKNTRRKQMKAKSGMAEVELDGEKVEFKEGALHKMMKTPPGYKFKKSELNKLKKVETGEMFEFLGKKRKMTALMKKRINFALTLMGMKKK